MLIVFIVSQLGFLFLLQAVARLNLLRERLQKRFLLFRLQRAVRARGRGRRALPPPLTTTTPALKTSPRTRGRVASRSLKTSKAGSTRTPSRQMSPTSVTALSSVAEEEETSVAVEEKEGVERQEKLDKIDTTIAKIRRERRRVRRLSDNTDLDADVDEPVVDDEHEEVDEEEEQEVVVETVKKAVQKKTQKPRRESPAKRSATPDTLPLSRTPSPPPPSQCKLVLTATWYNV